MSIAREERDTILAQAEGIYNALVDGEPEKYPVLNFRYRRLTDSENSVLFPWELQEFAILAARQRGLNSSQRQLLNAWKSAQYL